MLIVHVHVHVKPESVDAFEEATRENARNSVLEPGVVRFDVVRQADDPTRFVRPPGRPDGLWCPSARSHSGRRPSRRA